MSHRRATAKKALSEDFKYSKSDVHYRAAKKSRKRCYNCRYFDEGSSEKVKGTCDIVKDQILAFDTCDLFEWEAGMKHG